jgi:hypothetical protein
MANIQIVIETLTSGLKNQLQLLRDLEVELQGFESAYASDYKQTQQRIDNITVQVDKTIKDAISKIDIPQPLTEDEITTLIKQYIVEVDTDKITQDLQSYIDEQVAKIELPKIPLDEIIETVVNQIPKPKNGESVTTEQIDKAVSDYMSDKDLGISDEDKATLKRELRAYLANEVSKLPKAKDGSDGVGIEDIKRDKDDMVITLTDDTEKRISLPKPQLQGGGGGTSLANATSTAIVSTDKDISLPTQSQNVLVDATSGDVTITLPHARNCFFYGRSYRIGITRIDNTQNKVFIVTNGEMIMNETDITLYGLEVVNLITDGNNYYLGA